MFSYCAYQGCKHQNNPCSNLTFFTIPRDERREIWKQNSGNPELRNLKPTTIKYFCEEHFDSKFLKRQFNRTILYKTAVPYKYGEPSKLAPISISAAPISTSAVPISTSADPILTSAAPISTSADPISTSADPTLTSADPILTSADPILTSADPVFEANERRCINLEQNNNSKRKPEQTGIYEVIIRNNKDVKKKIKEKKTDKHTNKDFQHVFENVGEHSKKYGNQSQMKTNRMKRPCENNDDTEINQNNKQQKINKESTTPDLIEKINDTDCENKDIIEINNKDEEMDDNEHKNDLKEILSLNKNNEDNLENVNLNITKPTASTIGKEGIVINRTLCKSANDNNPSSDSRLSENSTKNDFRNINYKSLMSNSSNINNNDYEEDKHFALSLVGYFQRLPHLKKAIAKLKILQYLTKLELELSGKDLHL